MPWSAPVSIPAAGLAGAWVGDKVKEALKDEHWAVQHVCSAVAEGATAFLVGEGVNLGMADIPSAGSVTPIQALVQGVARAITGESIAKPVGKMVLENLPTLIAGVASSPVPALDGPANLLEHHAPAFSYLEHQPTR